MNFFVAFLFLFFAFLFVFLVSKDFPGVCVWPRLMLVIYYFRVRLIDKSSGTHNSLVRRPPPFVIPRDLCPAN